MKPAAVLLLAVLGTFAAIPAAAAVDSDGDGVPDSLDNCTLAPNPDQFDADGDGYGNRCDGDLNNNGVVNAQDTTLFRNRLGTSDPVADLNHNGTVNAQDTTIFRGLIGKLPGPAAAALGLTARPSNTTCVAPPRPTAGTTAATVNAYPTAPAFQEPTKILQAPNDPSRWYVLERRGRVAVFSISNPASATTYLDITNRVNSSAPEGGLLGMAFHPDFPQVKEVYLYYTGLTGGRFDGTLSRIVLDNATAPVSVVEQVLLTVTKPATNHHGGDLAFGNEGFLYLGTGDSGGAGDPLNASQDPTALRGKMLRINVQGVAWPNPGYAIPASNPFAANPRCGPDGNAAACPEIFAWGFRNPWRWSFDRPTGQLWLGDVGQDDREEVDLVQPGGNYGWRCREGTLPYDTSACGTTGFIEPVIDYPRTDGSSVTGGFVYRGTALPGLAGRYVFADYVQGTIWALQTDAQGRTSKVLVVDTPFLISAFGVDAANELYVLDYGGGRLHRLVPAGNPVPDTIPANLAATGCVSAADPTKPASGLIPYGVNAPFWSDGAVKTRYLALPNGSTIDIGPISGGTGGDWTLPPGSVLMKNFALGGLPIETRLLMRHPDGVWAGYTYEWNVTGTAATRVIGGKTRSVNGQTWIYPSESQCLQCHTAAAGFALGPETAQVNFHFIYPDSNRTANQLATLASIGLFSAALPGAPATLPVVPDPADPSVSLANRARAWLHTNCAQCHQPGGPTPAAMDLRYSTPLAATNVCNVLPQAGNLGIANARLIAPGSAARSVVIGRINRRDAQGMPPLGSTLVDTAGVALLTAWVNSLTGC
jgi:uncharacterized repeat protein (TIGR03806 family)